MGEPANEQLKAVVEMARSVAQDHAPSWTEGLATVTAFLGVVAWPLLAFAALYMFRKEWPKVIDALATLIGNLRITRTKEGALIIEAMLREAANGVPLPPPATPPADGARPNGGGPGAPPDGGAGGATPTAPTEAAEERQRNTLDVPASDDLSRAGKLELLAREPTTGPSMFERALDLASEYEQVRGAMAPGPERTRAMEQVMAKMRAISLAIYDRRHQLMADRRSPGRRLLAVACLQMKPDYVDLGWLLERLPQERPFVGYHMTVALVVAAQAPQARANVQVLTAAVARLEGSDAPSFGSGTDRAREIQRFKTLVRALGSSQ